MAASAFALAWPWVLRLAVDDLTEGVLRLPLAVYGLGVILLAGGEGLFRFLMRSITTGASRLVEYELRNRLFAQLQRQDAAFFQHMRTGDVVARATNDINGVRQIFGPGVQNLLNTAVLSVSSLALMVTISPRLALYSALILPMVSVITMLVHRRIQARYKAVQDQFGALSNQAQENFSGIRIVKAYAQEPAEVEDFTRTSAEYVRRNLARVTLSGALWPLMTLVSGLTIVVLIYAGGRDVIENRITLGQFVQFSAYLMMLNWPMIALGWVINLYQQGMASVARIQEVLLREPEIADSPRAAPVGRLRGRVEFRHVSLYYGSRPALQDVSFTIPAGATVAIVGPVGAGKSTLVSLIPRVFDASEGQVLIDGTDIRDLPLAELRRQIGSVPQETFLFSTTIRENISLGVEQPSESALGAVVEGSQLQRDLDQFPHGLDTLIGERGVTLSGGQRQRTAIARALLRDPSILILDDALSSVDTDTEERILAGLKRHLETRTSILISHRLSTIRDADLIFVLGDGRLVEQGTHRQLLAAGGTYARMYRLQLIAQELGLDDGEREVEAGQNGMTSPPGSLAARA